MMPILTQKKTSKQRDNSVVPVSSDSKYSFKNLTLLYVFSMRTVTDCPLHGYQCEGTDICLHAHFQCDGWHDCPVGDDEHNCGES